MGERSIGKRRQGQTGVLMGGGWSFVDTKRTMIPLKKAGLSWQRGYIRASSMCGMFLVYSSISSTPKTPPFCDNILSRRRRGSRQRQS